MQHLTYVVSMSRAPNRKNQRCTSKSAVLELRPMIDGLNLRASSRDTSLHSTTESLIIGG